MYILTGILLDLLYLFHNPYRVSRKFLQRRGDEEIHLYGETPLKTIDKLCLEAGITKDDHLFELGAGRGKTSFYIREHFKCNVTAIEQIPLFVKKAKQLNSLLSLGITFLCEDYTSSDLSKATLIYLYGTCLPEELIHKLCKQFRSDQKIISISYPLSDYDPKFKILKQFEVSYPWGNTEAYINGK